MSCSSRWRWLNVPRAVSWPVRRTGTPSVSSDANASASAWAQVMPPSSPSASRRRSSWGTSFGWMVNPSGTASSCSLSERSTSAETAVLIEERAAGGRARARSVPSSPRVVTASWASRIRRSAPAIISSTCSPVRRPSSTSFCA